MLMCRHLAVMKQRELENAKATAEEMEAQLAPLRLVDDCAVTLLVPMLCLPCAHLPVH